MWTAKPSVTQSEVPELDQYPTIFELVDGVLAKYEPIIVSPSVIASMMPEVK